MSKVPLGVLLLAVLNLLVGFLMLVGSNIFPADFTWLILGSLLSSIPNAQLIIALVYILLGVGLLTLSRWAWWLDIIFAIISLVIILLDFPNMALIPFIINLIIVLYLNQGSIRRQFKV